ncbi:MAG: hypothetical protein HRT54_13050 [Colwellia sp.]|nr:hypothetical protein [Colwellia sp.]
MNIHFKLNRDATTVTISRHFNSDNKRQATKLAVLDFTSDTISLPNSLSEQEKIKTHIWLKNQKALIEKAYKKYSRLGYVGGTPIVSGSGKYNFQFKDLQGCNLEAAAYSFLGCIKDARKLSLKVDAPSSIEMEEMIDNNELATVSKSIISAYCHKLISNHEKVVHKIYSNGEVEQLIEANLLLSKFITASKIKQAKVRGNGIEERVDQYFNELFETDEGYLIGKRLKVSSLLKQKNKPSHNGHIATSEDEINELNQSNSFNQPHVNQPQKKPSDTSQQPKLTWKVIKERIEQASAKPRENNNR